MKRIIALILTLVVCLGCASIFAGCGGNKQAADFVIPEGGYDGSAVTITFYHTMGENLRTVLDAYIEEFNKLYPNITIVHKQVGGYDDDSR